MAIGIKLSSARQAVPLLAGVQALGMIGATIMIVTSALTGAMLAETKGLATLPLGLQFLATMLATLPASFLMKRYGRRPGFILGACFGFLGAAIMLIGVQGASFAIFALGNGVFGIAMSFAQFYRFAAAEIAEPAFRPKAISFVLAGGVIAALFGPELAKRGEHLFPATPFAGGFLFILGLAGAAILLLAFFRLPPPLPDSAAIEAAPPRSWREILAQPRAIAAMISAMFGYGIMSFVMTASPLAMKGCAFTLETGIAFVIQWHVLAMFAPSFVTGHLIRRFGEYPILLTGLACYVFTIVIGLAGIDIHHFWLALFALGLGWNFLYVGGTSLLTKCYRSSERAKVQGVNDTLTFSAVALCSLIAGTIEQWAGWNWVLVGSIVPVLLIAAALAWGLSGEGRGQMSEVR